MSGGWTVRKPATEAAAAPAAPSGGGWKVRKKAEGSSNYAAGLTANFAQGILGGTADEVSGIVSAPISPITLGGLDPVAMGLAIGGGEDSRYTAARDQYRATEQKFAKENPWTAFGAQLAGNVITGLGAAKAVPASMLGSGTTLSNATRAVTAGAAAGTATGYASGEGGVAERAKSAAQGGLLGGVLSAILPAAGGIIRGFRGSRPAIAPGMSREDAAVAATLNKAITRDGMTPDSLITSIDRNSGTGKPLMLADMGGENMRGTLDAAVNRPGPAREMAREVFRKRQTGQAGELGDTQVVGKSQAERLSQDVRETVSDREYFDTIDQIAEARRNAAKPLYEQAYAVDPLTSPQIQGILSTPSGQAALKRAAKLAADEQQSSLAEALDGLNVDNIRKGVRLPMQLLDYVKRGLDDEVQLLKREGGNEYRVANGLRASLRKELVDLNPAYGDALDAWSGMSSAIDAVENGKSMLAGTFAPEQMAKSFKALKPHEQEFFLIGVARHLQDKIASVGQTTHDASKRVLTGTEAAKLRAILPPDKFRDLVNRLEQERQMFATPARVMGGSPTEMRKQNATDMEMGLDQILADRVTGQTGNVGALKAALQWVRDRSNSMGDETARARIAEALLSDNPDIQKRALMAVERQRTAQEAIGQQRGRLAIGQGAVLGGSLGNFMGGR